MESNSNKILKGSALRIIEFIASALTGLLLMPYIISALGNEMYGLWIFIGSFIGYYGLMDFGIISAVKRYVSRSSALGDYTEVNKIISTAFFLFLLIGFFIFIISLCFAFVLPSIMGTIIDVNIFRILIIIVGINVAIGFPLGVFDGILSANLRLDVIASIEIIKLLLRTGLLIYFINSGLNIIILACVVFFCDFVAHICKFFAAYHLFSRNRISPLFFKITTFKKLFSYSRTSFIINLADQLRFNIDNFVITAFLGLKAVTLYSIGSRLNIYFMGFLTSATGFLAPLFSQYEATNNYPLLKKQFVFISKISGYLTFLIGGLMIVFGKAFIHRWVGPEFSISNSIMIILVIASISTLSQLTSGQVLYGISKHHLFAYLNIVEGILNLIFSLILIKPFGILGVAFGTAIPMLICRLFILPTLTCRSINLSIKVYYKNSVFPVILSSSVVFIPIWFFMRPIIEPSYYMLFIACVFSSLIYVLISFYIGFTGFERTYLISTMTKMFHSIRFKI